MGVRGDDHKILANCLLLSPSLFFLISRLNTCQAIPSVFVSCYINILFLLVFLERQRTLCSIETKKETARPVLEYTVVGQCGDISAQLGKYVMSGSPGAPQGAFQTACAGTSA